MIQKGVLGVAFALIGMSARNAADPGVWTEAPVWFLGSHPQGTLEHAGAGA